ncbi:hypothetical protein PTKIN_Ptkin01aG0084000 [Pterospermum kingtungense]
MYLQFYINENGDKVYTTKKESPLGLPTQSAHPARFSPDDKYSRQSSFEETIWFVANAAAT